MYTLNFKKNRSKNFQYALEFALELGGVYDGKVVVLDVPDENLMNAYATFRTLFGYVQNWNGTFATYNGNRVHPFQFILYCNTIAECANRSEIDKRNCNLKNGAIGWSCHKINLISFSHTGIGEYQDNNRFWYNYGKFKNEKWVINKEEILKKLLDFSYSKALNICPFFDEGSVRLSVKNLPDYIIPDDITFKVHFSEQYIDGVNVVLPTNIRHIGSNFTFDFV